MLKLARMSSAWILCLNFCKLLVKPNISLLIFCLNELPTVRVLKSTIQIMLLFKSRKVVLSSYIQTQCFLDYLMCKHMSYTEFGNF